MNIKPDEAYVTSQNIYCLMVLDLPLNYRQAINVSDRTMRKLLYAIALKILNIVNIQPQDGPIKG